MSQPDWVLVVSQDPTTLQGLTRALARRGSAVAPAPGWVEGRSWLRRLPVSLVVTDGGEAGPEELARLGELRAEFPRLRVIALVSLWTHEASVAEAEGLVRAVLEKPIALERLEKVASAALAATVTP